MEIIKREEAIKLGLDFYFTGKPCKHGHVSKRSISYKCLECEKITRPLYRKEYRNKNRNELCKKHAEWKANNKESVAKYQAAYYANNKDKARTYWNNRRSLKLLCGGKLSLDISERLYLLQKGKCACCGAELGKKFHLDHIVPLAMGGENIDSNMQLLTAKCNLQKWAKHPIDFMQERGFLL